MTENNLSFKNAMIDKNSSILDALKVIDAAFQIAIIVDENNKLLGTVTDGDVRRAILRGVRLDSPVSHIMAHDPKKISPGASRLQIANMMKNLHIRHVPVVDDEDHVVGLYSDENLDLLKSKEEYSPEDVTVILMLGGEGERLRPITKTLPKPMIQIGGKPLLQTILESFSKHGFRNFFFAVNYMSDVIKEHFGDGGAWNVSISYLNEEKRLGTAGALSLLQKRPEGPMIVMNGDILTSNNFRHLLDFHSHTGAQATMCVREYQQHVPYGIVQTDGTKLTSFIEKPTHSYFVNAGIYVLSPTVLDLVPQNTYFDMPQLFEALDREGHDSAVFPIREYWRDIGRMEDLEEARTEYPSVFSL